MTEATVFGGKELDGNVFCKIVNLMEVVHNLPGNYDEVEALQVAKELQNFTINDLDHIDSLDIDLHE